MESAPLKDLKVVELATILAGPLVGQFCAELGARVIKVEPPGGDATRGWLLADEQAGSRGSAYFSCANRGKQSIVLDLRDDEDRRRADALIARSDVLITSFRPGAGSRLGLDPDLLAQRHPGLIQVQLSAYGAGDGRPGFDAIIQAEAGFTFLNGEPESGPVKMPVALMDVLAAHHLKQGLLLALLERQRTGQGSLVSTSLLASGVASLANQASNYLHAGVVPRRLGSSHPNIAPYGTIYETRDGRPLVIAVGTQRQFVALLAALDLEHRSEDPRFQDNAHRVENRGALHEVLVEAFQEQDSAALAERLQNAQVPFGFVHDMAQVFQQEVARGQLFEDGQGVRTVALDGSLQGMRSLSGAPALDQHRESILQSLGDGDGPD